MIEIIQRYRFSKKVLCRDNNPQIGISPDGEIEFYLRNGDGMSAELMVRLSPIELKKIRDVCNKALEKITGQKITTNYH